jgi:hypothetical protein
LIVSVKKIEKKYFFVCLFVEEIRVKATHFFWLAKLYFCRNPSRSPYHKSFLSVLRFFSFFDLGIWALEKDLQYKNKINYSKYTILTTKLARI